MSADTNRIPVISTPKVETAKQINRVLVREAIFIRLVELFLK
jgi:hypothetical protein